MVADAVVDVPGGALALYAVGLSSAALRTSVPEAVYLGGLVVGTTGVLWLSLTLLRTDYSAIRPSTAASAMSVRN